MSALVVNFTAVRTARMLKANAPPNWIDSFIAQMMSLARRNHDLGREAFWREVATLVNREARLAG